MIRNREEKNVKKNTLACNENIEYVYLSTKASTVSGGRVDPLHNVFKKEKVEEDGKRE